MIKTRYTRIYINGKLNPALGLKASAKRAGVYLIKDAGNIVYVGHSGSDIYRTFTRHFQQWPDRQTRVTFVNRRNAEALTARIVFCTPNQAQKLERALILKYKPKHNTNKLELFEMDADEKNVLDNYEALTAAPPF